MMSEETRGPKLGKKVPNFTAKNVCGKTFDLLELASKHRGTIINFFRANW
ncbi:MAG: hypothetical protein GF364_00985 [Candidatus Lokiarchaeota archaeon]|nr:hypothetical protein [Candidatus Lokiarchaeota archaeon]